MLRFLHAADIHLDSPLRGLEQYPGAPVDEIRSAARRAFENLVSMAIAEKVDFVLIAGDVYDGDWKDFQTGLFFIQQVTRLAQESIPVYLIRGNHDAGNRMTKSLRLPPNVHVFSETRPETIHLSELGVAIHGQSYPTVSVTKDLAFHYPEAVPGCFNIGLLHTSLTGREGHENYSPCSVETLITKGYDYWALGHIHQREIVHESPVIAFSGNIQGRHVKETGAKGCFLVTVDAAQPPKPQFIALDVLRWEQASIDLTDTVTENEVMQKVSEEFRSLLQSSDDRFLALRLRIFGRTALHRDFAAREDSWVQELRALAIRESDSQIWIEKIKFATEEPVQQSLEEATYDEAIGELELLVGTIRNQPSMLTELGFDLTDLLKKLPSEVRLVTDLESEDAIADLLNEARAYVLGNLFSKESDAGPRQNRED